MVLARRSNSGVRAGGAVGLAAVVAVGLVITPLEPRGVPVETRGVQLTAVVLSAVENSTPSQPAPADAEPLPSASLSVIADQPQAIVPAAAEGEEGSLVDSPLWTALTVVNFLLLPLWFFATPVTLPLSMLVAAGTVTMDGGFGTLQFLVSLGLGFLTGPLGLLSLVVNNPAEPAAAAGRVGSAQVVSPQTATTDPVIPATVAAAPETLPADTQPAAANTKLRSRLVERRTAAAPRAAAAAARTEASSGVGSTGADSISAPVDEPPTQTAGLGESGPQLAEAAEAGGSRTKSRATAGPRR